MKEVFVLLSSWIFSEIILEILRFVDCVKFRELIEIRDWLDLNDKKFQKNPTDKDKQITRYFLYSMWKLPGPFSTYILERWIYYAT